MRIFSFVMCILLAASVLSAANYTARYTAGWLLVTRTIVQTDSPCFGSGVSNVCMNDGAVYPPDDQYGLATNVTLTVQNVGQIERNNISIGEDLSFVPPGAKLVFSPSTSSNNGQQAFWAIGSLQPNQSKSVGYAFSATLAQGMVQRIPEVSIVSQPVYVSLSAPRASTVGDTLSITLKTASGEPVPGATVYVMSPNGSRQSILTGQDGVATFTASTQGRYTYSVDGYQLQGPVSTSAGLPAPSPITAAAVGGTGLLSSLAGILPVLAAIFVIAVVALIIYNFFASRGEEDDEAYARPQPGAPATAWPPPQPIQSTPSAPAQPAYTQSFSFSPASQQDSSIKQTTRGILESRRQLKQSGQMQAGGMPEAPARQEKEQGESSDDGQAGEWQQAGEQTEDQDEDGPSRPGLDSQIAKLEAKAREEGESASEEEEIERTIAELEAIREKLRSRKIGPAREPSPQTPSVGEEEGHSQEEAEEPEIGPGESADEFQGQEDSRAKPAQKPRVQPSEKPSAKSKPKKMKYASHGARKK